MRNAILSQSFAASSFLVFSNGILLVYMTAFEISSARIFLYLSMPTLVGAFLQLPFAVVADRFGKKLIGLTGTIFQAVGFGLIAAAGWGSLALRESFLVAGLIVYSFGFTLFAASWFALLSPIVPQSIRGRFFGRMRFCWQLVAIIVTGVCALFLTESSPIGAYQAILGLLTLALIARIWFYLRVPERERSGLGSIRRAWPVLGELLRAEGFASFNAYVFLLMLFTAGCPFLFGLIEKRVMGWGDNRVVWMGNMIMVGSIVGFYLGGKAIDSFGSKRVFLVCHFGFAAVIFLFMGRAFVHHPLHLILIVGALNFLFGLIYATSSIAISTEMMGLIPHHNKSLSTSITMVLMHGGAAMSGLICSSSVKLGLLAEQWTFHGATLYDYDSILLAYGVMIALLVVTLGLVPSVLSKAQWVPRG